MLISDFLFQTADRFPEKTAVIVGAKTWSFAELDRLSNRFARSLMEAGVRQGDRVVVLLENGAEAAATIFGVLKAGAVFVVISQTVKADKLKFIVDDCDAKAIVTQRVFSAMVGEVARSAKSLELVLLWGSESTLSEGSPPMISVEESLRGFSTEPPPNSTIDVDLASLIYTSGSTGFPKGVAVSHLNMVSAATSITTYLENVPEDVIINVLPFSFDYGLYQLLMATKVGATLVLEKSFTYPFQVVQRIRDHRVTGFPGVPTIFAMLLQMEGLEPDFFESVRYVSNTAAALPPAHVRRIQTLFRNAKIFLMYGLTECKRVSYLPPDELDRRPTSVGKGMPNEQVFIVDEEGQPVPPGTIGELVVRGSNVMQGYWNRPEETRKMIRAGTYPWERVLHTGDLFRMDDEGYLYFVARKDDIIKSRGEKVSPAEVERVIHELEEVREAAVVGVPDIILGQALKAFVVVAESAALSEKEVILHCARRLESFMVPKSVEFCEALPMTSTGKIRRKSLQDLTRRHPTDDQ